MQDSQPFMPQVHQKNLSQNQAYNIQKQANQQMVLNSNPPPGFEFQNIETLKTKEDSVNYFLPDFINDEIKDESKKELQQKYQPLFTNSAFSQGSSEFNPASRGNLNRQPNEAQFQPSSPIKIQAM